MPRWGLINREKRTGGLEEDEQRTIAPGNLRAREAGRISHTWGTRVDPASRKVIERGWKLFSQGSSAYKQTMFHHFLNELTPQQEEAVRRLGFENGAHLARTLAVVGNDHLQRILTHDTMVQGTKKAADRFYLTKNFATVIEKAAKGRKGFVWGSDSAKDDVASALIASVEHHGLGAAPAPEPRPQGRGEEREEREERGEREPQQPRPEPREEVPQLPEGAQHVSISQLLAGMNRSEKIGLFDLIKKGIRHDPVFQKGFKRDPEHEEGRIKALLDDAHRYTAHVLETGIDPERIPLFAQGAIRATDVHHFHDTVEEVIRQGGRLANVEELKHHKLPAILYDDNGKVVFDKNEGIDQIHLGNWHQLYQKDSGQIVPLSDKQRSTVAAFLAAKYATLYDPAEARKSLRRFAEHVQQKRTTAIEHAEALEHSPSGLSAGQMENLLLALALHERSVRQAQPRA